MGGIGGDGALQRMERWRPPERAVGEERRAALLGALEGLLQDRSFSAVSVGDVASAAGVGRSAFYFYFPSKGAAVSALLEDVFGEMLGAATTFLSGEGEAPTSVREALVGVWGAWRDHQTLFLAMLDACGTDPGVRELWDEWTGRFVDPIAATIDEQRRLGRARPGASARELVAVLIDANVRTYERLSRAAAPPARVEEALDALTEVWWTTFYPASAG